jgi:hypothetical protein
MPSNDETLERNQARTTEIHRLRVDGMMDIDIARQLGISQTWLCALAGRRRDDPNLARFRKYIIIHPDELPELFKRVQNLRSDGMTDVEIRNSLHLSTYQLMNYIGRRKDNPAENESNRKENKKTKKFLIRCTVETRDRFIELCQLLSVPQGKLVEQFIVNYSPNLLDEKPIKYRRKGPTRSERICVRCSPRMKSRIKEIITASSGKITGGDIIENSVNQMWSKLKLKTIRITDTRTVLHN